MTEFFGFLEHGANWDGLTFYATELFTRRVRKISQLNSKQKTATSKKYKKHLGLIRVSLLFFIPTISYIR